MTALAFAMLAAWPVLTHGGFLMTRGGGDSPFLLLRLHQLVAGLTAGEFPVRWMPDAAYGYGYPFFNYYAALAYYLAAALHLFGFSFVAALKLTQIAALLAAAGGTFAWVSGLEAGSRARALLAAAAYTFAPFHLVNLYVRGDSLSELWAMALFPWILWAAQRCLRSPTFSRLLGLAGTTALLALTHNISALNFMPLAALYILLAGWRQLRRHWQNAAAGQRAASAWPIAASVLALVWGLALSAFFWLPALRDTNSVQLADVTQGYFYYANHFRARDLVQSTLFFNAESAPGRPSPFSMGLAQAVLIGLGLAACVWRAVLKRRWTATETFLLAAFAAATWMITPASAWAWAKLPLVRYTQFPWRFLSIQALFGAALTMYVLPPRPEVGEPYARGRKVFGFTLAAALGLILAVLGMGKLRLDFVPLPDADVTPQQINLMEAFSANIGSTIGFEYLPKGVIPRPYVSGEVLGRPPELKVLQGQATGQQLWRRGAGQEWEIVAQGSAIVAVPLYNWPGWSARVDGQPMAVRTVAGLGWLAFDLGPGSHRVTLRLEGTPTRRAAETLSLVALLAPLAIAGFVRVRRGRPAVRPESERLVQRPKPALIAAIAFLVVVFLFGPWLDTGAGQARNALPLSMDFIQYAYPVHDVVRFAGGSRLVSVSYSSDRPARGESLRVDTRWQVAAPAMANFALVPASNLLNAAPSTLDTQSAALQTGNVDATVSLEVPATVTPGLYFVTVSLDEAGGPASELPTTTAEHVLPTNSVFRWVTRPALTSSGRERGLIHLAPVFIDDGIASQSNVAPLASFGPLVELLAAGLQSVDPRHARLALTWRAKAELAINAQVAVRLRDAGDNEWAASDAQTGYGFYPAHLWRAGEAVVDVVGLELPEGAPPGDYNLSVEMYDPSTLASLGSTTLVVPITATSPAGDRQPRFSLGPDLALTEVGFPDQFQQGDAPEIKAGYLTLAPPSEAYQARWRLAPAAGTGSDQETLTQVSEPAPGSPATSWPAGAYVLGRVRFATPPTLAPGNYALSLTLLDEAGLPVTDEQNIRQVLVIGRARNFEVPALRVPVGAQFGGVLRLEGYTLERESGRLRLELVWSALQAPRVDYKYFVHLFNQSDGFVARQVDAMPHDFGYPTGLWAAGEVVTDSVTLTLDDLAAGRYGLAVGWYDPQTPDLERLPALDAQGEAPADNRVVLGDDVVVP